MLAFPSAKINIGLNVVEKRNDGFHNIESIFYPIDLTDVLEVIEDKKNKLTKNKIKFTSSGFECGEKNNLCIRAYSLIDRDFNLPPVRMHLHKNIPVGAGLGGGSSDAAFTIKLLNEIFGLNLTVKKMQNYASKLGSDCAFFIENKPAFCFERGDRFEEIRLDLSKYFLVLINPGIHINTAEAYRNIKPAKPKKQIKELIKLPLLKWEKYVFNDFEKNIFSKYPQIKKIKENFYKQGAIYSSMTGSGSSVYGIFNKETKIKNLPERCFIWYQSH
ncbi:MAG: 4-(cytidine 5'-diphospho)-2-C-methyl-D-erythritol kinase [Bacteroidales bacterium]|nr:4-(cytidine 5'-diphospho)-2-C-methyl-D-erythritol kinase [Bacteroidales bacterium]